jgi:hypothetical protein
MLFDNEFWFDPSRVGHPDRLRNFDLELTTVSSCFRIRLETVRDQSAPTLPTHDQFQTFLACRDTVGSLTNPTTGNFARCTHLTLIHASLRSDRYGASAIFEIILSNPSWHACANKRGPSDTRWSA